MAGAVTVGLARSYLSESFPEFWLFFLGAIFIGSVILFPMGIVGSIRDGFDWLWRRISSHAPPDEEPARALASAAQAAHGE
jgi:urea transport system permease protein